jgi:hypothetical protein
MANYNDLYMRDALDDTGAIPYIGRTACFSPDIIPAQLNVISPSALINSYGTDPTNTNINTQQINNIYVRARNLASGPASGTIGLYYNGYFGQFLKFCFTQALSSWWNRSRFVFNMVAAFSPLPSPQKIAFIFNAAALVVNITLALKAKPC